MNPTQSLSLTRFVRAACPQQKFDEYTPDAWHELLSDLEFADCRLAVSTLGKRQPFISPAEIRTEVRRIRNERITAHFEEPEYDLHDVRGGLERIRAHRKAIGDGNPQPAPRPLPPRDVKQFLEDAAARLPQMPSALPELNDKSKRPRRAS